MDYDTKRGTKVRYLDRNGYDGDREYANKFLKEGEVYTVEYTNAFSFSSTVALQEFPGKEFNTVMFEAVDQIEELEPRTAPQSQSTVFD